MHIRRALLVVLLMVAPRAHALDYPRFIMPYTLPGLVDLATGDINGDGLVDIVTLHRKSADTPRGYVAVTFQRPSHNFDFPISWDCDCDPRQLRLVPSPLDPRRKRILFYSLKNGYSDVQGGFTVVDLQPDGSLAGTRYDDNMLFAPDQTFSLVDVNQDGRWDVFHIYENDDHSTPGVEESYRLWYDSSVSLPARHGRPPVTTDAYRLYQGPVIFNADGTPVTDRVDFDGDGATDVLESGCPTACLFQQQPYGQLVATPVTGTVNSPNPAFADLDGDGLPDQIAIWKDPNDTNYGGVMSVFLQTAPLTFTNVGGFGYYFGLGPPIVSDLDNNGLNDVLFPEQDAYGTNRLHAWLQTAPGQFRAAPDAVFPSQAYGMGAERPVVADVDADGCRDVFTLIDNIAYPTSSAFYYFTGRGCHPAANLAVRATWSAPTATIVLSHRSGTRTFDLPVLRVVVASTVKDDSALGLGVRPPAGCMSVAAQAPRRIFDCPLTRLAPGKQAVFSFRIDALHPRPTLLTAFLLSDAGDIDPDDNRVQLRIQPASKGLPK